MDQSDIWSLPPFLKITPFLVIFRATINEKIKQNDLIHYYQHLCSITICNRTEQNAPSFQSLTVKLLGSFFLLTINCCINVEEAENIEILVSLTVLQFPLWFPSVKWQIREREGNRKMHSHSSGTEKEWKKTIPIFWEREGNEKNPFPQFGNGNQRLSFPRIPGNGNEKT